MMCGCPGDECVARGQVGQVRGAGVYGRLPPALCVCLVCVCVCVCVHSCTSTGKLICLVGVSVCLGSRGCESASHPCHKDAVPGKWERVFTAAGARGRLGGGERAARGLGPARGKLQSQPHSEAPGGSCRSRPFLPAPHPVLLPLIPEGVLEGPGWGLSGPRCGAGVGMCER